MALNNLAWLYQQKGDLAKARGVAEQAAAAAPRVAEIDDTLGWILLAQGEAGKALTHLSAASRRSTRAGPADSMASPSVADDPTPGGASSLSDSGFRLTS